MRGCPVMDCPTPDDSMYECYALDCNPALSVALAGKHFRVLDDREIADGVARMTAAAAGKSIPTRKNEENHWIETSYGRQYWEMKTAMGDSLYGARFPRPTL